MIDLYTNYCKRYVESLKDIVINVTYTNNTSIE